MIFRLIRCLKRFLSDLHHDLGFGGYAMRHGTYNLRTEIRIATRHNRSQNLLLDSIVHHSRVLLGCPATATVATSTPLPRS